MHLRLARYRVLTSEPVDAKDGGHAEAFEALLLLDAAQCGEQEAEADDAAAAPAEAVLTQAHEVDRRQRQQCERYENQHAWVARLVLDPVNPQADEPDSEERSRDREPGQRREPPRRRPERGEDVPPLHRNDRQIGEAYDERGQPDEQPLPVDIRRPAADDGEQYENAGGDEADRRARSESGGDPLLTAVVDLEPERCDEERQSGCRLNPQRRQGLGTKRHRRERYRK